MTPEEVAADIVKQVVTDIDANMKASMRSPKSGIAYKRRGAVHVSSAPGEAPAVISGNLVNSITSQSSGASGKVVVAADYAGLLDEGTSRMQPRPFADDAIKKALDKL